MNLFAEYDAAIQQGLIDDNAGQRAILTYLQRISDELQQAQSSWWPFRKQLVKGAYIYGSVGVGKTFLVDLFYQHVAEKKKARFHFHHFMQQIDHQLRMLQGKKDPLRLIAKRIAATTRVVCFDEFLVDDVAYAMILAELLKELCAAGVVLIISSNTKPDDLYLSGVHRERFLPAIALINQQCTVLHLGEQRDYRLGRTPLLAAYLYPINEKNEQIMAEQFSSLAKEYQEQGQMTIQNRTIPYYKCGLRSVWFYFDIICHFPRSQLDYLEIADKFDHLFISNIPALTENHTLQTIMFIHLIDVMYDRGIKLIISAAVPLAELYVRGEMKDSFQRTLSRLNEMQSVDYLNRHPRRCDHDMG